MTAVVLEDGAPTALFHPCGHGAIMEISVESLIDIAATPSPAPSELAQEHTWRIEARYTGLTPRLERGSLRLLNVPRGWDNPLHGVAEFKKAKTYLVSTMADNDPNRHALPVQFTLADLAGLSSNEIWGPDGKTTRMRFARNAEAACI